MERADSIEQHFNRCFKLVDEHKHLSFRKARALLSDDPMLSFIEATRGKYDLDELAIEFDLDDRMTLTAYLSGLFEYQVGVIEWILLTGAELMHSGYNK